MVLEDDITALVTCHLELLLVVPRKGRGVAAREREVGARVVGLADVAVDAAPAILARTFFAILPHSPMFSVCKGVAFCSKGRKREGRDVS